MRSIIKNKDDLNIKERFKKEKISTINHPKKKDNLTKREKVIGKLSDKHFYNLICAPSP